MKTLEEAIMEFENTHDFLKYYLTKLKEKGRVVKSVNPDNAGTLKEGLIELPHQFFCIADPSATIFNLDTFKTQPWWMVGELLTEFLNINPPIMNKYRPDLIEQSYKLTESGRALYLYGSRWTEFNQLERARAKLAANPNSKRVIIQTWMPYDMQDGLSDVPCNTNYMFLGRDGVLDMTATIRSNDILRGVKYDYYLAGFMLQSLAAMTGMKVGKLYFLVNSLHTYEKDSEALDKALAELSTPRAVPKLALPSKIDALDYWHNFRHLKKAEESSYNGNFPYFEKNVSDMTVPLFRDFARIYGIKNAKTNNRDDLVKKYKSEMETEGVKEWTK
jgi:thymidylate synthase